MQLSPSSDKVRPSHFVRARADATPTHDGSGSSRKRARVAALFYRSRWTQEELAKKERKTQPWVVYQLRFGRFLTFITTGYKDPKPPCNLSERRFRGYWEQAEGNNERIRCASPSQL